MDNQYLPIRTQVLDHLLDDLRREREQSTYLKNLLKEKTEGFRLTIQDTVNDLNITLEQENRLREKITDLALRMYADDPEHKKDIHPKLKERDSTTLSYEDTEALKWCIQHTLFLHVDKKRLEGYIKSLKGMGVPSWVSVEVVPTITIAQDL